MEPPTTRRPTGHPVVAALESDDIEGAFLSRMVKALGPGDWRVPTQHGFWWTASRLRHEIEILRGEAADDDGFVACRSTFTLVEEVEDVLQGLEICNYLNQRPLGAVALFDPESAEITFTTGVRLSAARWFDAVVFEHVVQRLVGLSEFLAPRLAGWASGRLPNVEHPTLGRRISPDRFLDEAPRIFHVPEAGTGIWWSNAELQQFRYALRFLLEQGGFESEASLVDVARFDASSTTVDNLTECIEFDLEAVTAQLCVWPAEHHDVGAGVEVLLRTNVTLAGEQDRSAAPTNSADALSAANLLNIVAADSAVHLLGAGAWSAWRGQLSFSMFLPPEVIRIVQSLARGCAGTVMALMSTSVLDRRLELSWLLAQGEEATGPWEAADQYLWDGVEMNAGRLSLYVDSDEVFARVTEGLPINEIFDPIALDDDAWLVQHNEVVLRMGIFNPMGPTIGTIEFAINYRSQQALLLERSRHPFSPSLDLYAVLDREGFDQRAGFVEAMISRLSWGVFDWVDVRERDDEMVNAITRGLESFAESRDFDFGHHATSILEHITDPWARISSARPPRYELSQNADPHAFWIPAITDPRNINAHYAMIRSAWEGALAFHAYADAAEGQQAADDCVAEILARGGTHTPPP